MLTGGKTKKTNKHKWSSETSKSAEEILTTFYDIRAKVFTYNDLARKEKGLILEDDKNPAKWPRFYSPIHRKETLLLLGWLRRDFVHILEAYRREQEEDQKEKELKNEPQLKRTSTNRMTLTKGGIQHVELTFCHLLIRYRLYEIKPSKTRDKNGVEKELFKPR
ncbi:hypothetical protein RFI_01701, partial [Reticulomyxa filosa]